MDRSATYEVVEVNERLNFLVIRDVGFWDRQFTITNDAEGVVERIDTLARLPRGRRLFYYDSEGELDEILLTFEPVEGMGGTHYPARFAGFQHCPATHHWELPALLESECGFKPVLDNEAEGS